MKALLCEALGPADHLVVRDLPEPVPGPGEIVIAVRAAALNFFDTLVIQGRYQAKPPLPFSPSAECAGIVSAIGEGVTGLAHRRARRRLARPWRGARAGRGAGGNGRARA